MYKELSEFLKTCSGNVKLDISDKDYAVLNNEIRHNAVNEASPDHKQIESITAEIKSENISGGMTLIF